MPKEVNNFTNFVRITISKIDIKFYFTIFRENTYTDTLSPFNSHHSNIKLSAFNRFIHRLLMLLMSPENYNIKLQTIIRNLAFLLMILIPLIVEL